MDQDSRKKFNLFHNCSEFLHTCRIPNTITLASKLPQNLKHGYDIYKVQKAALRMYVGYRSMGYLLHHYCKHDARDSRAYVAFQGSKTISMVHRK